MRVAVIGLGLIGASLARALAGKAEVLGMDANPSVVRRAEEEGVVLRGCADLRDLAGCDMVVLALPVGSIVDAARKVLPFVGERTTITDTGSTKARIVGEMDKITGSFVGSHPIAGKERPGYDASDRDLFVGAAAIITPSETTSPDRIAEVKRLWEACGSTTHIMDPASHDRLMAKISHLPHLLSYASMGLAEDVHIHRQLLGAGFRDFTRIAASDPLMWKDILMDNRDNVLPLVEAYIEELHRLKTLVEEDRATELETELSRFAQIRRALYESPR
ncbi:MAG TPA: prephenate dehydrogenase [Deltaproteobacteria bacterium]|nr:prephenate dehydrogenase [Deltaproteobacteria bacterium]HPP81411.1 prephenate dehydrogenase [Deltaproteobacteria bacterium]